MFLGRVQTGRAGRESRALEIHLRNGRKNGAEEGRRLDITQLWSWPSSDTPTHAQPQATGILNTPTPLPHTYEA